jgi:hypothetical protein
LRRAAAAFYLSQSKEATIDLEMDDAIDDGPDVFALSALGALRHLVRFVDSLLISTANPPLTPPSSPPHFTIDTTGEDPESPREKVKAEAERKLQSEALARRFYSKHVPPITIEDYLKRLHQYCPLSPAVYLAVSVYIYKLAVVEQAMSVTPLNAHRLLLAGVRVASKALEDENFRNSRFARVGGITDREMGRLEVGFCFLMSFNLKVDAEAMKQQLLRVGEDTE